MLRRDFIQLGLLASIGTLVNCGDSTPWWYKKAEAGRIRWNYKDNSNLTVFTGDSILEEAYIYYPEYYDTHNAVNVAIGGIQTKELYHALKYMGAFEREYKALYILSGHHDLDMCSKQAGTSIEWRSVRAIAFFAAIIERVHANNPNTQIYLMNLPPLINTPEYLTYHEEIIYFNTILKEYAGSWGPNVTYEDRWSDFIGTDNYMRPELTWDAHHPNREGAILYMDKYNV
jgi:hypothetical protein